MRWPSFRRARKIDIEKTRREQDRRRRAAETLLRDEDPERADVERLAWLTIESGAHMIRRVLASDMAGDPLLEAELVKSAAVLVGIHESYEAKFPLEHDDHVVFGDCVVCEVDLAEKGLDGFREALRASGEISSTG